MRRNWFKQRAMKKTLRPRPSLRRLECLEDRCVPATITVTDTGDTIAVDGLVTLREAITSADNNADVNADVVGAGAYGSDTIHFNIPGAGVHTISPLSTLPQITTDPVVIDGGNGGDATNRVQISGGGALSTGLDVEGPSNVEIRNLVINGFTSREILVILGSNDVIQGNFLGLDSAGTAAVPNSGAGVEFVAASTVQIGGTTAAARNVIAGRAGQGITVDRSSATIQGNFIGLDATGSVHLGDFSLGVSVANGFAAIGGTSAGARNVIVARTGILFGGNPAQGHSSGTVQGNFIGTDAAGTTALNLGNGAGVDVDHAVNVVIDHGNVISGNGVGVSTHSSGVSGASSSNTKVQGNLIGTAADGVTPLGNSGNGVETGSSPATTVGGLNPGEGNVIAFNGGIGVFVGGSTGNTVLGNSIFGNGGLGIDLATSGVTPNDLGDTDTGDNNLQNFPVITGVNRAGGNTTITGILNSTPNTTFRIEFFANDARDSSIFGEGQTFLGFTNVTTDASGNASFSTMLPVAVGPAQFVTATATDPGGNTSEFSDVQNWNATALSVGADGKVRLLWNAIDDGIGGGADVWSVTSSTQVTTSLVFGPFTTWRAVSTAAGSDGFTRLLWDSGTGDMSLWLLNSDGTFNKNAVFGTFADWRPREVAVGNDNAARILWTNSAGQAVIWRVDNDFAVSVSPVFGPLNGWTCNQLSAGSDGLLRLLWNKTNGAAALWILDANSNLLSSRVVGPIAGWTAIDVAVGADDTSRILWSNSSGQIVIWNVTWSGGSNFSITTSPVFGPVASVFGPVPGWSAAAFSIGADGLVHVLWNYLDGTAALWLLNADDSFNSAMTLGPV